MKVVKSALLVVLVFAAAAAFSQDQFIEVVASDTIYLKPLSFVYKVAAGEQVEFMGMKMPVGKQDDSEPKISLSQVEAILKKEKFALRPAEKTSYKVGKTQQGPEEVHVVLNSKAELERLVKLLQTVEGVSGDIVSMNYESPDKFKRDVMKTLYERGKNDASLIASLSGRQLGELIQVTEVQKDTDPYTAMMEKMSKSMPFDMFANKKGLDQEYIRTFQFRFSVK